MRPGESLATTCRVTQNDFDRFAALTGDDNPIHVDVAFSARTRFGKTLCHGMLLGSLVAEALRTRLGPGAVAIEQELKFPGPAFAGDELCIRIEALRVDWRVGVAELAAVVSAPSGICCEARTVVRFPSEG